MAARMIGVLLLAAMLSACSAIRLGYGALGEVAWWWLDGFFSFNEQQSAVVRDELRRLHAWHRTQELPRINDLLARAEQMAPGELAPGDACSFIPQIQARIVAASEQAELSAATVARMLTPRELKRLQGKYDKLNAAWRKDWMELTPEELREKRMKMLRDRFETIYGTLAEPQLAALRAGVMRSPFDPVLFDKERKRRQQDLVGTLRQVAGSSMTPEQARAAIAGYRERLMTSPDPQYRAYQRALFDEECRTIAGVHAATTPQQRDHAVRRLRAYQRDLSELAAAGS